VSDNKRRFKRRETTEFTFTLMYKLQGSVADREYIRCTIYRDIVLSKSIFDSNIETLDMEYTKGQTVRLTSIPYLFIIYCVQLMAYFKAIDVLSQ
jgi:hypothetical protein